MKIIIIGSGNFGIKLAKQLNEKNHDVIIIDNNKDNFSGLGLNFSGIKIEGMGYDKTVLEKAKISECDIVIACSSSDSINAVVGNIAKNVYHVPFVIVRMYDSLKAKIFSSMGLYPISITSLGVEEIMEIIQEERIYKVKEIGKEGALYKVKATSILEGFNPNELMEKGKYEMISIVRENHTFFVSEIERIEVSDLLYYVVKKEAKKEWSRKIGGNV